MKWINLDLYNQPKLNQEHIKHLSSPITNNEIEAILKRVPMKKSPGPDGLMTELHHTFK
jgi:hypothetical protein